MPSRPPQTWTVWESCNPQKSWPPGHISKSVRYYNRINHVNKQYSTHYEGKHNVSVSQQEIIAGIAEIIEEVTGIEPSEITPEKSFVDDLDIDSLSMMTIVVNAQDKFNVEIPDDAAETIVTVGDAIKFLEKNAA